MAFSYGFYNSVSGDRKYTADQMSSMFDGVLYDGVFSSIGDKLIVKPGSGLQVLVGSGRAWFNHTWTYNDADLPLTIAAPDVTQTRIDAVILEVNSTTNVRANSIYILQGTPSSNPAKPGLRNSGTIHQYPLAYVTVPGGATSISKSNIQNTVGTSACPFSTGIMKTATTDELVTQWNGQFDDWFTTLKTQMTDNVALNLQNQINARLTINAKSTTAQAQAGTDNTTYMTPAQTKNAIDSLKHSIGDICMSARNLESTSGGKYLTCDGRALNQSSYTTLFNAINTRFGRPVSCRTIDGYGEYSSSGDLSPNFCARSDGGKLACISNKFLYIRNSNGSIAYWINSFSGDSNTKECVFFIGETVYTVSLYKSITICKLTLTSGSNTATTTVIGSMSYSGSSAYVVGMMKDGTNTVKLLIRTDTGYLYVATVTSSIATIVTPYSTLGKYGAAILMDNYVYTAECNTSGGSATAYKQFDCTNFSVSTLSNNNIKTYLNILIKNTGTQYYRLNVVGTPDSKTSGWVDNTKGGTVYRLIKRSNTQFDYNTYPIVNSTDLTFDHYRLSFDNRNEPVIVAATSKQAIGCGFIDLTTGAVNINATTGLANNFDESNVTNAFEVSWNVWVQLFSVRKISKNTTYYAARFYDVVANESQIRLPDIDIGRPRMHFIKVK